MAIYKTPKGINIYQGIEPTTIDEFFTILKETLIELKFIEDKDKFIKSDIQVRFANKIGHKVVVVMEDTGVWATFYLKPENLRNIAIGLHSGIHLKKSSKDIDSIIELNIPESISLFNFILDFIRVLWELQYDHKDLLNHFKNLQSSYP
jgi:hypothetical protein